jgi:hypothetical protein
MSKPSPARYRTTNWSSYTASLRKRGSLPIWLDKAMTWLAPHDGSPGRPAVFSDAAIQFCLTIKVLFKLTLRQTTGMVASLLKLADLDWAVPDYTTLCRRQKTLAVQIPCRRADGPLNLLVDSTGIKFLGDGEWRARKHGVQGRRQWRKVHLAMDTATSDIRGVRPWGWTRRAPDFPLLGLSEYESRCRDNTAATAPRSSARSSRSTMPGRRCTP